MCKQVAALIALLAGATSALATTCPADPTQLLQGSRWAFQTITGEASPAGSSSVGTFRGLPNGVLQVTQTVSTNGRIMRRVEHNGRYQVYPDCTGGELMFMLNGAAVQIEFVFHSGFDEMYLVSDSLLGLNTRTIFAAPDSGWTDTINGLFIGGPEYYGAALTGTARRTPTLGCPQGIGNPLNILHGTNWAFQTGSAYARPLILPVLDTPGTGSVGLFQATNVDGSGRLAAIETISGGSYGTTTRRADESGRYLIYDDCSGGELMLMNRGNPTKPVQLEFVFVGQNFDEIYFLNDALPSSGADLVAGQGKRFAQNASACPADAASLLVGSTWAFHLRAADFYEEGSAAVGRFTVFANQRLEIAETISMNGRVMRGVQHSGRYILYPDCSGGELLFHVNGHAVQLEFVYAGGPDEMYFVTDVGSYVGQPTMFTAAAGPVIGYGAALIGAAKRTPPQACPAQPLSVIAGQTWSFRTRAPYALNVAPDPAMVDPSVGIFRPNIVAGAGVLEAIETITNSNALTRRAPETGRYQIYPDCSGGEIMIMNRGAPSSPVQLEFVFAGPGFREMYFLNDSLRSTGLELLIGEAKLF